MVLDLFHAMTFTSKLAGYSFYKAMMYLMDPSGLEIPSVSLYCSSRFTSFDGPGIEPLQVTLTHVEAICAPPDAPQGRKRL